MAALQNDARAKQRQKYYADKKCSNTTDIEVGDIVLVKQEKRNKLTTRFNRELLTIVNINGSQITARRISDGVIVTRNCSFFKKLSAGSNYRSTTTNNNNRNNNDWNNNNEQPHFYGFENGEESGSNLNATLNLNAPQVQPPMNNESNNILHSNHNYESRPNLNAYYSNVNTRDEPDILPTQNELNSNHNEIYLRGNPPRNCGPPERWSYSRTLSVFP